MNNYKRLGDYIRETNLRNTDESVELLLGVSIEKHFIPSIANTVGTDLSKYKVVKKDQFAYGPVTSRNGDRLSVALLKDYDAAIISQSYISFEIINTHELLPDYLMMWFSRPEFDRYARYKSHGSTRETFSWEEMCNVELPLPSLQSQQNIVAEYNSIKKRIELNKELIQKLEETAQAIYKHWFARDAGQNFKKAIIKEFGKVITGKTPSSKCPEDFGNEMPFITPGDFVNYFKFATSAVRKLSKIGHTKLKNKVLPKGTIIVTCIGSDMGKIVIAHGNCITNQQMNSIVVNEPQYTDYLYYYLKYHADEKIKGIAMGSSTMPMLSKTDFEKIKLEMPPESLLKKFETLVNPINETIICRSKENDMLLVLKSLLLSKMNKVEVKKEREVSV